MADFSYDDPPDEWTPKKGDPRFCTRLSDKVAAWSQKVDQHKQKQLINPFSEWEGASHRKKLDKDDPLYGRPVEGSKTSFRGAQAHSKMTGEMMTLCDMIYEYGDRYEDGTAAILFGELFQIYTRISSKVVGTLIRARKHGVLYFEGETLFQRKDDDVPIVLQKPITEIRKLFRPRSPMPRKKEESFFDNPIEDDFMNAKVEKEDV